MNLINNIFKSFFEEQINEIESFVNNKLQKVILVSFFKQMITFLFCLSLIALMSVWITALNSTILPPQLILYLSISFGIVLLSTTFLLITGYFKSKNELSIDSNRQKGSDLDINLLIKQVLLAVDTYSEHKKNKEPAARQKEESDVNKVLLDISEAIEVINKKVNTNSEAIKH